jgi:hypothetical protein
MNREEFVGDVVRHTKGGVVHCQGHPQMGKVDYGPHNCQESMEAGDGVIIYYVKDHERDDEEWYQRFRFCANCDDARRLPEEGRQVGKEQAVVEGLLEHFEGTVEGKFYDDAVRLIDAEVLAYSPESEGQQ